MIIKIHYLSLQKINIFNEKTLIYTVVTDDEVNKRGQPCTN